MTTKAEEHLAGQRDDEQTVRLMSEQSMLLPMCQEHPAQRPPKNEVLCTLVTTKSLAYLNIQQSCYSFFLYTQCHSEAGSCAHCDYAFIDYTGLSKRTIVTWCLFEGAELIPRGITLGGGLNENISHKLIWQTTWSLVSGKGLRTVDLLEEALRFQSPLYSQLALSALCLRIKT